MESGSPIPVLDASGGQAVYDQLVSEAGCSSSSNTFLCLQTLPYSTLINAVQSFPSIIDFAGMHLPFLPRVDGSFISDQPQHLALKGAFAKVPIVTGDQFDEGTVLTLGTFNVTTTAGVDSYIQTIFPGTTEAVRQGILKNWPQDITQGSPFNTGILNNLTGQNKRIAAIIGDIIFQAPRRFYLNQWSAVMPTWSYASRALRSTPFLGTFHVSDTLAVFGLDALDPCQEMQTRWISFATNLDPNPKGGKYINWPQWGTGQQLLQFGDFTTSLIPDTFRLQATNFITQYFDQFAF